MDLKGTMYKVVDCNNMGQTTVQGPAFVNTAVNVREP